MMERTLLVFVLIALAAGPPTVAVAAPENAAPEISIEEKDGELVITVGGAPLATYVERSEVTTRPFFKHLHAPGGIQVTRNYPPREGDRGDHAGYHPGLSLAFGDISGNDYWRMRNQVVHVAYTGKPEGGSGKGTFSVRNRYTDKDGGTVCTETCRYTFLVRPLGYLILVDSTFHAEDESFYFGDQEEMGLTLRVHTPMNVKGENGRILNANWQRNEKGAWGKVADWCDYGGPVDGKFVGVTLMPHPENFGRSWFHARDYGVLVANPFGNKAFAGGEPTRVVVEEGGALRLRFGVFLHAGESEGAVDLNAAYADYLEVAMK